MGNSIKANLFDTIKRGRYDGKNDANIYPPER